jgi:hypothetical protein
LPVEEATAAKPAITAAVTAKTLQLFYLLGPLHLSGPTEVALSVFFL